MRRFITLPVVITVLSLVSGCAALNVPTHIDPNYAVQVGAHTEMLRTIQAKIEADKQIALAEIGAAADPMTRSNRGPKPLLSIKAKPDQNITLAGVDTLEVYAPVANNQSDPNALTTEKLLAGYVSTGGPKPYEPPKSEIAEVFKTVVNSPLASTLATVVGGGWAAKGLANAVGGQVNQAASSGFNAMNGSIAANNGVLNNLINSNNSIATTGMNNLTTLGINGFTNLNQVATTGMNNLTTLGITSNNNLLNLGQTGFRTINDLGQFALTQQTANNQIFNNTLNSFFTGYNTNVSQWINRRQQCFTYGTTIVCY
jgi:hypothetical protein